MHKLIAKIESNVMLDVVRVMLLLSLVQFDRLAMVPKPLATQEAPLTTFKLFLEQSGVTLANSLAPTHILPVGGYVQKNTPPPTGYHVHGRGGK